MTSPLPLDESKRLRLQIADTARNEVIQMLKDWGHELIFVSVMPRVCSTGLQAACLWEIDLPRERQAIIDDRIRGEIAQPKKTDVELEGMRRYLGLGPKK